MPHAGRVGADH